MVEAGSRRLVERTQDGRKHHVFRYRNGTDKKTCIWFEPWAEEIWVEPGSKVDIKIYYVIPGEIDTEQTDQVFVLWLWLGCRAQVFVDGQDRTVASMSLRVPV